MTLRAPDRLSSSTAPAMSEASRSGEVTSRSTNISGVIPVRAIACSRQWRIAGIFGAVSVAISSGRLTAMSAPDLQGSLQQQIGIAAECDRFEQSGLLAPARWSRRAGACPAVHGRSCRRLPWSRRARRSCRSISCRYPHARLQGAFAGVDQIHDGEPFGEACRSVRDHRWRRRCMAL